MNLLGRLIRMWRPYRVRSHPLSREEIIGRCGHVTGTYRELGLVSPFSTYRKVVDALIANTSIEVRPMNRLMAPAGKDKAVVALRHDLDGDVVTGVRSARYLASKGLPGSFYLLHTAHYYGTVENNVFRRFAGLESFVAEFVATGCELGLHTDPLSLYCTHRIDGAEAVRTEIAWLRSLGANLSGTVAHNSAIVFGAENFEIFRRRGIGNRRRFSCQGQNVPLQALDEQKLGLTYEGNYPVLPDALDPDKVAAYMDLSKGDCVRDPEWLRYYFLENPFFGRAYDVDIWLLARDAWVIAKRGGDGGVRWPVNTEDLLLYLGRLDEGVRAVVCIHPEYVSGD